MLRSDLVATLKNNADCKLKVFETRQTKLLGSELSERTDESSAGAAGPDIGGIWHDANDPGSMAHIAQHGDQFEFTRPGL